MKFRNSVLSNVMFWQVYAVLKVVASTCHELCSDDSLGPTCCSSEDGQTGNVKESSEVHAEVEILRDTEAIVRR